MRKGTFEPDNVELVGIAVAAGRGCGVSRCGTTITATALEPRWPPNRGNFNLHPC